MKLGILSIKKKKTDMAMKDRIKEGKLFTDNCEGLPKKRIECKIKMMRFNSSSPDSIVKRAFALNALLGKITKAWVEPPFYCCYGTNITIGEGSYLNFNCNFVDDGEIIIGKKVMFGPNVTIATVGHPINPNMREYMYTDKVIIDDNCWIGASVVICPGVHIGKNSVIGAGSVVISDIPENSVAVGNPCKIIRQINEHDEKYYYKDRLIDEEDLKEEAKLRKNK